MPPNLKQKIISLAILTLLVFQPVSFVFAEETTDENQSPVLVKLICDNNNCVGEITAQITEDVVGIFPFVYNIETNTALVNISPEINLIYIYNTDNAPIPKKTKNIYARDTLIATVETVGTTVTPYFVHTDHLGSTNVVTDSTGTQKELLDYYPYGSIRLDEKAGSIGSPQAGTFSEQRKYIGQEYDEATSLSYLNARYYNGQTGRFITLHFFVRL